MVVIVGQSAAHKNHYVTQSPRFNIYSKRFARKQNVSTDNVFLLATFHTIPRRPISTSNFFALIAVLCNNMQLQVSK